MRHVMRITLFALALAGTPAKAQERIEGDTAPGREAKPSAQEETVTLKKGESRELRMEGLSRVAVGDPQVADVDVEGKGLLRIEARKAGETTLLVWAGAKERRAYRIVVRD